MKINKGSIIDIIAISSKPDVAYFDKIKLYVESLGFVPRIAENVVSYVIPFYSNTNEYRANLFKEALLADDSNVIWFIRGGIGATEIIDHLEGHIKGFEALPSELANDKLIIGFSDVTAIHSYLINKYNIHSLHAEMLERIVSDQVNPDSVNKLEGVLSSELPILKYELIKLSKGEVDTMEGKILGGNLTLVTSSIGTSYESEYDSNFLILEDVGEDPTRIERSLTHLLQSHALDDVQAVIFGDFIADIGAMQKYVRWTEERFVEKISTLSYAPKDMAVFVLNGVGHTSVNNPVFLNLDSTIYKEGNKYFITMENPIELISI